MGWTMPQEQAHLPDQREGGSCLTGSAAPTPLNIGAVFLPNDLRSCPIGASAACVSTR